MSASEKTIGGLKLGSRVRTGPYLKVFTSEDKLGRAIEVYCYRAAALRDRTGREAFLDEARRTADLHHENLCLMVDAGEDGDAWYAVTVAPDAPSLRDLIERGGALAPERVEVVAEGILAGLRYLGEAGLRHGDVRPETVFLSRKRVLLAPRRLVPLAPGERDARYLAPEEIRIEGTDVRTDLFSFGSVLAEALTGEPAFPGDTPDEVLASMTAGRPDLPDHTPPDLRSLVADLLSEDPGVRPLWPPRRSGDAAVIGEAPPAVAVSPATSAAPPATPAARPAVAPRRASGVLISSPGGQEAVWDLLGADTYIGLTRDGTVLVRAEPTDTTLARISPEDGQDVLRALPGASPHPRVNGSLVDSQPLTPGDEIRLGEAVLEYRLPRPETRRPPRRESRNRLPILLTAVLCLLAAGWGAWRIRGAMTKDEAVLDAAAAAEARLDEREAAPAHASDAGVDEMTEKSARVSYEAARRYADENPRLPEGIRERFVAVRDGYGKTIWASLAQKEIDEIDARRSEARARAFEDLAGEAGRRIEEDRLYEAYLLYHNYAQDHGDDLFTRRAGREAANLLEAISARFGQDWRRAEEAVERNENGVALDVLSRVGRYAAPGDADRARRRMEEIRGRLLETAEDPGGSGPIAGGPGAGTPAAAGSGGRAEPGAGPGSGPGADTPTTEPDPKAEAAAERLFGDFAVAVDREKWKDADRLLARLDELAGTRFFAAHRTRIEKARRRIRVETLGYAALFKGEAKVIRGREVEVVYRFDRPEEAEDWVFVPIIAHPVTGNFWRDDREKAMHGRGVGAAVNPAVFEPAKLTMRARVKPDEPHDFGFVFLEPEEMVRYYMFTVQNRFFTIGYEREAAHETMIWIVGGTAWSDTKTGDIGFVRVAGMEEPTVKRGEWATLLAEKKGDRVGLTLNGKSITGSALGDDRFRYPALQPGIFLVETEVLFDEIVIHGTLDEKWAETEMRRLRESLEK